MTYNEQVKTSVLKNAIATTKMRLLRAYMMRGSHGRSRLAIRRPRGREYGSEDERLLRCAGDGGALGYAGRREDEGVLWRAISAGEGPFSVISGKCT